MTDKKLVAENLAPENFAESVLKIESENLKKLDKEDKKSIVAKIIRFYEEAKKSDNK